jgi:hypothetical protein
VLFLASFAVFEGAFEAPANTAWARKIVDGLRSPEETNRNILKQYGILKMYNLQKAEYD